MSGITKVRASDIHWAISAECSMILERAGYMFTLCESDPLPIPDGCKRGEVMAVIVAHRNMGYQPTSGNIPTIVIEKSYIVVTNAIPGPAGLSNRFHIEDPDLFDRIQEAVIMIRD